MITPKQESLRSALVVCGKFHYFNYASELADRGILQQFLYSHRLESSKKFKTYPAFRNLFLKEYLFQAHSRFLGNRLADHLNPLYHRQWDATVALLLKRVEILHFLMHGNCINTLGKAKSMGIKIIGEAVNSHPIDYLKVLEQEHEDLGLAGKALRPKFVERILDEIPLTDRILVPSDFVRESYMAHGVPAGKLHKIPYGANLQDFVPAEKTSSNFRVICVAQVALRKGHQYLLRAWKQLNLPNAELHCYGSVDQTVLSALKKIDSPNVFFHGSVNKARLIQEIQNSSVFVLPTVEEGFAVSILEGLGCGIPVLTTTHSGAKGVITHDKDGLLVIPRSVDELCENLEKLYRDDNYRRELGRNGRKLVEDRFNWQAYLDQLVSFYREA